MLIGMASEISKNYTYKCVDCLRHNGIKVACYSERLVNTRNLYHINAIYFDMPFYGKPVVLCNNIIA